MSKSFKEIIEELKSDLNSDKDIIKGSQFKNTYARHVWISDADDIIGNTAAHYEIIIKNNNLLYVDLHFEGSKTENDRFSNNINELPNRLKWLRWRNSKSIRVAKPVNIDSEDIIDQLKENLFYLENNMGNRIREIIKNENISVGGGSSGSSKPTKQSLNQILFGPPGTGKTYHTINKAIEIIDPDFDLRQERKTVKEEYDRLVEAGQVVFTTFHQSMSYEDFVEGIKPLKPIDGEDAVKYDVIDGIFKKLCDNATETKSINNFNEVHKLLINEIIEKETLELSTPKLKSPFVVKVNRSGNCVAIPKTEKATEMVITKKMLYDYLLNNSTDDWKSYTVPIGEYLKNNFDLQIEEKNNLHKKFVLIIDEINRGNVSAIFGELITLIEEDKRIGREEELRVVLPYSKNMDEKFGVPANLYIIGTMNTADRSVEALDTALRRRFSFVEMPPKPDIITKYGKLKNEEETKDRKLIIDGYEVDLAILLETINKRLKLLLDRDHLIGHSYFMNVDSSESLKEAFSKQIMPLLQEYFYGDHGKISLVLGEGFCKGEKVINANEVFAIAKGYETDAFNEKILYSLKDPEEMNNDEFRDAIKLLLKVQKPVDSSGQDAE